MSIRTLFVGDAPAVDLPGLGVAPTPDLVRWNEDLVPAGPDPDPWRSAGDAGPFASLLPSGWPERPFVLDLDGPTVDRLGAGLPDTLLDRLSGGSVPAESYRFVQDGRPVAGTELSRGGATGPRMEPAALTELTARPGTSVFAEVQAWSDPHAALAAAISADAGCPVSLSCFVSSPAVPGFPAHYDTHHAVLVQLSGSKTWRCSAGPVADPGDEHPWPRVEHLYGPGALDEAEVTVETTLTRGSALWIPPGWVHRGRSGPDSSSHLTVALQPLRRYDLVMALALSGDGLRSLRRMVPPRPLRVGVLSAELRDALSGLADFVRDRAGTVDGRLAELLLSVQTATPAGEPPQVQAVRRSSELVELHLGARVLVADGADAEAVGRWLDGSGPIPAGLRPGATAVRPAPPDGPAAVPDGPAAAAPEG